MLLGAAESHILGRSYGDLTPLKAVSKVRGDLQQPRFGSFRERTRGGFVDLEREWRDFLRGWIEKILRWVAQHFSPRRAWRLVDAKSAKCFRLK